MGVRKETFTIAYKNKIQHIVDNNFNLCMPGSDKLQTVCVGVWCVPNGNPSNNCWDILPTNVTLMDKMLGDEGFFTWTTSICTKLNGHQSNSCWDVSLDQSGGHWTHWLTDIIVEKKTFCNSNKRGNYFPTNLTEINQLTVSPASCSVIVTGEFRLWWVPWQPWQQLDWKCSTEAVYRKGQSFSFNVCSKMLHLLPVCCFKCKFLCSLLGKQHQGDTKKLNRLVKTAGTVVGTALEPLERRMMDKPLSIMDTSRPLHDLLVRQQSNFSGRLLQLRWNKDRYRKSFLQTAIAIYNDSRQCRERKLISEYHCTFSHLVFAQFWFAKF